MSSSALFTPIIFDLDFRLHLQIHHGFIISVFIACIRWSFSSFLSCKYYISTDAHGYHGCLHSKVRILTLLSMCPWQCWSVWSHFDAHSFHDITIILARNRKTARFADVVARFASIGCRGFWWCEPPWQWMLKPVTGQPCRHSEGVSKWPRLHRR